MIPYADEFGFFLHIPRVRASLEGTARDGIPLALQNAIILISLHLTEPQQQFSSELTLLSTSSRQLADIIPVCGTSTRDLLHVIQTQVLLAIYLSRVGRTIEARYYLGAAASLALAFRLHSSSPSEEVLRAPGDIQYMLFDIFRTTLPRPVDHIEWTETLHAFWTIFTRDKCVSAVLGVPPSISRSVRITIPWPGQVQEAKYCHPDIHSVNNRPGDVPQADTIQNFLDGVSSNEGDSNSMLAAYAKALILFDKVNDLIKRYTSGTKFVTPLSSNSSAFQIHESKKCSHSERNLHCLTHSLSTCKHPSHPIPSPCIHLCNRILDVYHINLFLILQFMFNP